MGLLRVPVPACWGQGGTGDNDSGWGNRRGDGTVRDPGDALGTRTGDRRTGEPRAKAFTHGGGRGNGSFTGGGVRALEQPVHEDARAVAAAAVAAGVGASARAQDPVTAHALRGAQTPPQPRGPGGPEGPGPACTHQAAPADAQVRGAGAAAGAVQHPAEAVVEVVPLGQAVEVAEVGGCQSRVGRDRGDAGDSRGAPATPSPPRDSPPWKGTQR